MALSAPSATPPLYVYDPLPPATIRLLKIKAEVSSFDDPIICDLHHVGLDPPLEHEYTGLSYAWGDPIFDQIIYCGESIIEVTSHLQKALQRLRQAKVCWVWIDAICIDQSNKVERSAQVSIMGRIYGQTQMTFVYLGEAGEDTAQLAELVRHLACLFSFREGRKPKIETLQRWGENFDDEKVNNYCMAISDLKILSTQQEKDRCLQILGLPVTSDGLWRGYRDIYACPWFRRGWVTQEAVLSPHVRFLLGNEMLELKEITASALIADEKFEGGFGNRSIETREGSLFLLRSQQERWGLLKLLSYFRRCETTDPRDKIYSLLGLAEISGVAAPKPDYDQSVRDVFISYAKYLMQAQHGNGIHMLLEAGVASGSTRETMTWVPQWDKYSKQELSVHRDKFSASGSTEPVFSYGKDSALNVRGAIFDGLLEGKAEILSWGHGASWSEWERKVSNIVRQSPTFCLSRYAKALVADGFRCCMSDPSISDPSLSFANIYEQTMTIGPQAHFWYGDQAISWSQQYSFVLTNRGYMGWVPKCTELNDRICIIFGVELPLVIREVEDGKHILIGHAYIEGSMQGEALKENNVEVEDITLV